MAQTQIELTEDQLTALEKLAEQRNVSLSDLIQEGINNLLQSRDIATRQELKQRALSIAGRFRSGLGDLSRRHDDYFTETLGS